MQSLQHCIAVLVSKSEPISASCSDLRQVTAYLVKISVEPMHVDSQMQGPSGGDQSIGATQEGSHCLQHILEPTQLHLLPGLQAHEGLVLKVLSD